jgi:hypothetical protein
MATDDEERDGALWVRKTVREIREVFKFWGVATIERIVQSLIKKGYIVTSNFDEGAGKSARWVSFDFDKLKGLKSIRVDCSIVEQRMFRPDQESAQSGTSVLSVEKNKEYIPESRRSETKAKPEEKFLYPPADFPITEAMWISLAERQIVFTEKRVLELTDQWHISRNGRPESRKRTVANWQSDWLGYMVTTWQKQGQNGSNGNGHGQQVDETPSWMHAPKRL